MMWESESRHAGVGSVLRQQSDYRLDQQSSHLKHQAPNKILKSELLLTRNHTENVLILAVITF